MTKDISNTNSEHSTKVTLNVPRQMALTVICRGAQSSWNQLVNAMKVLEKDSDFKTTFNHSFANQQGILIGNQQQLLSALAADPSYLSKASPPTDVFSRSVWLTLKIYAASKTISTALSEILKQSQNSNSQNTSDYGLIVKKMLIDTNGLIASANKIVETSSAFSIYLKTINGDLDMAVNEYDTLYKAIYETSPAHKKSNIISLIELYASSKSNTNQIQEQLAILEIKAAKVSCFSIIENMTRATQSLTTAWSVVKKQFETISNYDTKELGDLSFLDDRLKLSKACDTWHEFSDILKNFSKKSIIIN